jgi:hypothetical protein
LRTPCTHTCYSSCYIQMLLRNWWRDGFLRWGVLLGKWCPLPPINCLWCLEPFIAAHRENWSSRVEDTIYVIIIVILWQWYFVFTYTVVICENLIWIHILWASEFVIKIRCDIWWYQFDLSIVFIFLYKFIYIWESLIFY